MTAATLAEKIADLLSDAVQSDCENGVKLLNEIAAQNYLKEYPQTAKAIDEIWKLIDDAQEAGG